MHLKTPRDANRMATIIEKLPGIEAVLSRQEAARKFHQLASRIGELVVLEDRDTVFGKLDAEMESLPPEYRSHGSTSKAKAPLYIYNAERAPDPEFFRANVDLTR